MEAGGASYGATLSDREGELHNELLINSLGMAAGVLTTMAFVPQLHKAVRTNSTRDISLGMLLSFNMGVVLWLVYGILLHKLPIILANAVTLMISGSLLALKIRQR